MSNKSHAALCLGLCTLLAASPLLAAPPPGKGNPHKGGHDDVQFDMRGPSVDIGQVRIVLGKNRQLIGPSPSLPPGIAKNLARGKPLPPGIAKNFDSRLSARLPHYEGYEWKQVGSDVVLVAVATGIVYEILRNVLN
ncbi:anti-virulence regulator CigR family protein [Pseudomonas sp. NCHU5208]|uniref:anti-virulence regulator CigR family protein n=1 Tax=unclassified Pseudomonas TaxID=196821 RepID=UPI003F9B81EF